MPAVSEKQRRFFGLIRAIQKGKAKNASPRAKAVARSISPKDARDFASKTNAARQRALRTRKTLRARNKHSKR